MKLQLILEEDETFKFDIDANNKLYTLKVLNRGDTINIELVDSVNIIDTAILILE